MKFIYSIFPKISYFCRQRPCCKKRDIPVHARRLYSKTADPAFQALQGQLTQSFQKYFAFPLAGMKK
jgi:hypothetical protein